MGISPWSDETSVRESVEKGAHVLLDPAQIVWSRGSGGVVSKRASVLDIAQIVSR